MSYIPEIGLTRPGENITVYCVFNDPSVDASMAVWTLNMNQQLPQSQYHAVNRWVRFVFPHQMPQVMTADYKFYLFI